MIQIRKDQKPLNAEESKDDDPQKGFGYIME
jgi:hypothetical protein